jgi:hypothetical protein
MLLRDIYIYKGCGSGFDFNPDPAFLAQSGSRPQSGSKKKQKINQKLFQFFQFKLGLVRNDR